MLRRLFCHDLYVQVRENQLTAKSLSNPSQWAQCCAAFSTRRLLVGQFSVAEAALKQLLDQLNPGGWIPKQPRIVIHPRLSVHDSLSEVEERIFRELALGAGAFKVILHQGSELSDQAALALLNAAKNR